MIPKDDTDRDSYPRSVNRYEWVEILEPAADYCLGVLPPIYFRGGFAVSEPIRHTAEGAGVYCCVHGIRGRSFARECTIAEAEAERDALEACIQ